MCDVLSRFAAILFCLAWGAQLAIHIYVNFLVPSVPYRTLTRYVGQTHVETDWLHCPQLFTSPEMPRLTIIAATTTRSSIYAHRIALADYPAVIRGRSRPGYLLVKVGTSLQVRLVRMLCSQLQLCKPQSQMLAVTRLASILWRVKVVMCELYPDHRGVSGSGPCVDEASSH